MLKSIAPKVGLFGLWTAVLLIGAGCVDHRCPRGYDQKGDTCYRIKDAGPDGATVDASGDDDPLEDAMLPALRPDADSTEMDGGTDPDLDAMLEAQQQSDVGAPPPEPDGGMQSPPEDAASSQVASCSPNPCQNGGTCRDGVGTVTCVCPEPFTGDRCELEICGDTTIRTLAELDAARPCKEIRGKLSLLGGATEITASDLPNLTKITGDLVITSFGAQEPFIESVTLAALQVVEGGLRIGQNTTTRSVMFPALTTIGKSGSDAGFQIAQAVVLGRVDMPQLTTIYGDVLFLLIESFCSLNVRRLNSVSGDVTLHDLPNLAYSSISRMSSGAAGTVSVTNVGCCLRVDAYMCDSGESVSWDCSPITCP